MVINRNRRLNKLGGLVSCLEGLWGLPFLYRIVARERILREPFLEHLKYSRCARVQLTPAQKEGLGEFLREERTPTVSDTINNPDRISHPYPSPWDWNHEEENEE